MEVTSGCIVRLVMCDYDIIPLQDEIARRFIHFICGCMHCNSTFISSVVSSVFTNMNYSIDKNVRLCALKYGIDEEDVEYCAFKYGIGETYVE